MTNEDMLLAYWQGKGGRDSATGLTDVYRMFRVLRKGVVNHMTRYRVQWVGFSAAAGDTTWETKRAIVDAGPGLWAEFEEREEGGQEYQN